MRLEDLIAACGRYYGAEAQFRIDRYWDGSTPIWWLTVFCLSNSSEMPCLWAQGKTLEEATQAIWADLQNKASNDITIAREGNNTRQEVRS